MILNSHYLEKFYLKILIINFLVHIYQKTIIKSDYLQELLNLWMD